LNCRLCQPCWTYWKRYGGLKKASRLAENDIEAVQIKPSTPTITVTPKPIGPPPISDIEERLSDMGAVAVVANHRPHRYCILLTEC
jgi:hypothetical protein